MKINLWIALFLLLALVLKAQHPYEDALDPIKDILPPSPTAAGLGVYGEIPVSLHTGIPTVSIPLTSLKGRSIAVPISLSYHGGGHQVDATSSWVGLGWSLNAGGVISRTVHGLADDDAQYGYWNHPIPDDFLSQGVLNPATQQQANEATAYLNYLEEAAAGNRDGQPDQFNFNINGYAGRFYVENTGNPVHPLVPRLVPHQDIKIELEMTGTLLEGFILTTPDGTRYKFGGLDITGVECVEKSKSNTTTACGRTYNNLVTTSWYLRQIEAVTREEVVNFVYEAHTLDYEASISETINLTTNQYEQDGGTTPEPCPTGVQSATCISYLRVNGVHLKRIEALGGKVAFTTNNQREDIAVGGVRLTEITQYGVENGANYLKKFVLSQDYFLSNDATQPAGRHKRLRLNQVQEFGLNATSSKPPHIFEYEATALPPRLSRAKDFWGYYNGQNSNTTLIPASIPTNANFHQGGGNRYPNFLYAKAGVLNKITYPTGGHTFLEYEGHELGYDTPIPELLTSSAGMSALYYQQASTNTYTSTFTLTHEQDVLVKVDVFNKCGIPAQLVSYLKIEEKDGNGNWQPLSVPHPDIVPASSTSTNNDGPGTIDFGVHPTVEITQNDPYSKEFELTLPAGEYQLTAAALNGTTNTACNYEDELSIFVIYEEETGNLIYKEDVGGLRIKKMTTHDGLDVAKDMIKEYDYSKAADANHSSGQAMRPVKFKRKSTTHILDEISTTGSGASIVSYQVLCEQQTTTKFSESQLPLHGISGGHIAYKEVTVLDGNNGANGKTWNKYKIVQNTAALVNEEVNAPMSLLDWQGGVLLEQIVYKKQSGNYIKVQESIHDYEVASIDGSNSIYTFSGHKVGKINNLTNFINSTSHIYCDSINTDPSENPGTFADYDVNEYALVGACVSLFTFNFPTFVALLEVENVIYVPNSYIPHPCEGHQEDDVIINYPAFSGYSYVHYPIYSGWNKLTKTTLRQYEANGVDYVETITEHEYDNIYTHLTSTQVTNSDGTIYTTESRYPTDYTIAPSPTPTDPMVLALQKMQNLHQHALPIEQKKYIQKQGGSKQLVGGMFTTFEVNPDNANAVNPVSVYRSELATPVSPNTSTLIDANNNFVYGNFYTLYGSYTSHNDKGLPLGFQRHKDLVNSFVWGYEDRVPILKATHAHHTELGYTSFEAGDEANWNLQATASYTTGKVGNNALQVTEEFPVGQVFRIDGQEKTYQFSAWVKTGGSNFGNLVLRTCSRVNPANYPNVPSAYAQTSFSNTNGEWQLVEVELDVAQIRADAGLAANDLLDVHAYLWNPTLQTIEIDAVRFHPVEAFVETYDYEEATLLPIAMEGLNRIHSSYHYDDFQRLSHAKDFEGNILLANAYHYKNGGSIENHVSTKAVRVAGKTTLASLNGLPLAELTTSYQYVDGLGRSLQEVAQGQSPNGKDRVTFMDYDAFGRQHKTYLPYANASSTGAFNSTPISQAQTFYSSTIAVESQSSYPYAATVFEASPLNRPLEQSSPGDGWELGTTHTTKYSYSHNKVYPVLQLDNASTTAAYYDPKVLTKTEITNTRGIKTVAYKDKLGRIVLSRQEIDSSQWTNTYTLYNEFGNVKAVITPAAVELMEQSGNYNYTDAAYAELIYTYTYDKRQRLSSKKVPNTAVLYYVYDQLDRPVATQDGNQRAANQWLIQKYDVYSRPILSALYSYSSGQLALQNYFDQQSSLYEEPTTGSIGYTNTLPVLAPTDDVLSINYYDNYDFDRDGQVDVTNNFVVATGYAPSYFDRIVGQATGSKTLLLDGTGTFLKEVVFYDERGRVLQSKSQNHLAGEDISHNAYDFIGQLTKTQYLHSSNTGSNPIHIQTEETFEYDHTGRLLKVYHQVGNDAPVLLSQQHYDELGRLIQKQLHGNSSQTSFLQSIDYHYNIKDWLVRINDLQPINYTGPTVIGGDDLFSMNFEYDYGGNISHLEWQVRGYDYRALYDYSYDKLNRLTNANYREYLDASTPSNPQYQRQGHFSVNNISYDIMGNITSLQRKGTTGVIGNIPINGQLDNLTYTYTGNQLQAVEDAGSATEGFVNGASLAVEYSYDNNGNVLTDANKGITVGYNYLNLPDNISFTGGEQLEWLYTAGGQKLRKKATTASSTTTTKHYIGKVQYLDTGLEFINHPEGRIIPTITGYTVDSTPIYSYAYEYTLQDHLGNARVFFSDRDGNGSVEVSSTGGYNEVLQQEHYYPFGMGIRGEWKFKQAQIGGVNLYQYNGKELNEDFGLNWNDYEARWYDASTGRWGGVDPLAESYNNWSEYNYVMGNPIRLVDPDGMRVDDIYVNENGVYLGRDGDEGNTIRVVSQETWDNVKANQGTQTQEGTALLQNKSNSTPLTGNTKEQPGYQRGINITEETWDKIEAVGGMRVKPHLVNGSPTHIFVKPEENIAEGNHGTVSHKEPERVESGEQVYGMIDGFSTPEYPGYVWKVTTNNRVYVMHNHHVGTKGNSAKGMGKVKAWLGSVIKTDGWIHENGVFKSAIDETWKPLYDAAK